MTTTTTTPVTEAELRRRIVEVAHHEVRDAQAVEVLLYGIQHGMTTIEEVETTSDLSCLIWGQQPEVPDEVSVEDLEAHTYYHVGRLEEAWLADQRTRAVPVVCPTWCTVKHRKIDPNGDVILPFFGHENHECALGGEHNWLQADLVQVQHWSPEEEIETFISICGGDDTIQIKVEEFDAYADDMVAILDAARNQLREIRRETQEARSVNSSPTRR